MACQEITSDRRIVYCTAQEGAPSKRAALWGTSGPFDLSGQACDVFICHHGPVKHSLLGHIKERLERANLVVFADYEMQRGVDSWPHVLATLRGARGVLILLTPGFEESPWCLEEARAAAVRLDAVLPVLIDREASWDDDKLAAAFIEFAADRDFHQLRAEEPGLAANILEHWHKALDSLASVNYIVHTSTFRWVCSQVYLCLLEIHTAR